MTVPSADHQQPQITLVGTGVVGRAILKSHVDAGLSVRIADRDEGSIVAAVDQLNLDRSEWQIGERFSVAPNLTATCLVNVNDQLERESAPLLIESIPERLDLKQGFFGLIETLVDSRTVLCSNTSTLGIGQIAQDLSRPQQFAGMHFFMPVDQRSAVELIRSDSTDDQTIETASSHVRRLGKSPLVVKDSPGFIVNRLLSPYLNEALTLLCQGVSAEAIEEAALSYGMPISPLELIDTIGTRTMFDAGRVYWQAFPNRIDPSPLLAGLVKSKRSGKYGAGGLYDYADANRSRSLSTVADELIKRYRITPVQLSDEQLIDRLAIPMWIEAAIAHAEGTVTDITQFDLAMQGGLGYHPDRSWLQFFDDLGSPRLIAAINHWSPTRKSMKASERLINRLSDGPPSQAMSI